MRAIFGLDPSSKKIALAVSVNGNAPILYARMLPNDNALACLHAYRFVRKMVGKYVKRGVEVYLFIEEPVVGRGGARSTIVQSLVQGGMLAGAASAGAEIHKVNNSSWKKKVVGNGNAGKPQIKEWVRTHWPHLYDLADGDQDCLDAGCILKFGMTVIETKDKIERLRLAEAEEDLNTGKRR